MSNTFADFLSELKKINSAIDSDLIKRAYEFAESVHADQKRASGRPYISHPIGVALIVAEWGLGTSTIVTALLHDTIVHGGATKQDLEKEFGTPIAELVANVSQIREVKLKNTTQKEFIENLRRMVISLSQDIQVVIIKIADRLHNIRTLRYLNPEDQIRIAKETLEVYAPLADRMEMGQVKTELEDQSFPYVYPEDYQWLTKAAEPYYQKVEEIIPIIEKQLPQAVWKENIKAEINTRRKGLYSLYKKILRPEIDKSLNQIHDLAAIRIIVNTIPECYKTLDIIQKLWKHQQEIKMRDYIANPKKNGYRSIHDDVIINGMVTEFQIRTYQMHQEAELGIAAHFHYSEMKNKGVTHKEADMGFMLNDNDKLSWVKQLVALHNQIKSQSQQEQAPNLKLEALSDRIFVYTPNGDVVDLPQGATPIDFAYQIHTHLGDLVTGAKVNGKLTSLDHHLSSGDVCELLKSKNSKDPNPDWLDFVATNVARTHIKKHLRGLH